MNITLMSLVASCCATMAWAQGSAAESVRGEIIERYSDLEALALTARFEGEDRYQVIAADRSGASSRRTFWLEMLERAGVEHAGEIWRDVASDFAFTDGHVIWGMGNNDTYTVNTIAEGRPWGANPVHWCVWVVLPDWARDEGELRATDDGGWVLRIEERFMEIRFDSALNVERISYWYDLSTPEPHSVWVYSGYGAGDDPRLPTRFEWVMKLRGGGTGGGADELRQVSSLEFELDPERARALVAFFDVDGAVNLVSISEAQARVRARESGKSLDEVLNGSDCGPIEIGFTPSES